ncbi:MAG: 3-isopropylmalate dehydratase [Nitrospinota bacterium]|nr:3-isopropylmalate dehydratase [Nitrospinota bacterium]
MQEIVSGLAYVLGNDIDTDQIIPAEHLVYSLSDPEEKKNYGKFALSGVPEDQSGLPEGKKKFVAKGEYQSPYSIIVGGKNFGCGSSREHAPACLKVAGIQAVLAESFARIFYRNSIDGGFFLPMEATVSLYKEIKTGDSLTINTKTYSLTNQSQNKSYDLKPLGDIIEIVKAGNIFEYARKSGLIKS